MYFDGKEDLIVKFENAVPEDNEFKLKERQVNIQTGLTTIDEERQKQGLEPFNLPETSKPLIPFSLVPAGTPKPETDSFGNPIGDKEDDKENEDEDDEEKKKKSVDTKGDRVWRIFAQMTRQQEIVYAQAVARFFEREHKEVMVNINKFKGMGENKSVFQDILMVLLGNEALFRTISNAHIRQSLINGLILGGEETGKTVDFDLYDINVLRLMNQRAEFVASAVRKGTEGMLDEALKEGFANGESIEKIAGRIDRIYDFNKKFRARRIAQTEVIGATNQGKIAAYEYARVEFKEWVTSRDELVRDSHRIDGQTVSRTQPFKTADGYTLNYPGDRSTGAPPETTVNCRCTMVAAFK